MGWVRRVAQLPNLRGAKPKEALFLLFNSQKGKQYRCSLSKCIASALSRLENKRSKGCPKRDIADQIKHPSLGFLLWRLRCLWFYRCKPILIRFQSAMRINTSFCHDCLKASPATQTLRPLVEQYICSACHSRISSRLPNMGVVVTIPSSIF